jgi:hypothetical protein
MRPTVPGFAEKLYVIVCVPFPVVGLTVSHAALELALHPAAGTTVSRNVPVPLPAPTLCPVPSRNTDAAAPA